MTIHVDTLRFYRGIHDDEGFQIPEAGCDVQGDGSIIIVAEHDEEKPMMAARLHEVTRVTIEGRISKRVGPTVVRRRITYSVDGVIPLPFYDPSYATVHSENGRIMTTQAFDAASFDECRIGGVQTFTREESQGRQIKDPPGSGPVLSDSPSFGFVDDPMTRFTPPERPAEPLSFPFPDDAEGGDDGQG